MLGEAGYNNTSDKTIYGIVSTKFSKLEIFEGLLLFSPLFETFWKIEKNQKKSSSKGAPLQLYHGAMASTTNYDQQNRQILY